MPNERPHMNHKNQRATILWFAAILISVLPVTAGAQNPHALILSRAGNLPIILTAPHGGLDYISGVLVRTRGVMVTDANTLELTDAVAKRVGAALGAEPYLVAARFSRKYIDANRAEKDAFESAAAKPVYWAYHNRIAAFIAEIRQKFPDGALLLDIHGQGNDPYMVYRGTRDGRTVPALLRKSGIESLIGPNSILGYLQSKGVKVFPLSPALNDPPEHRGYTGGHTVYTYGSNNANGIDAIQLELGTFLRNNDSAFVENLAGGIVQFYRNYLVAAAK